MQGISAFSFRRMEDLGKTVLMKIIQIDLEDCMNL